MKVKHQIQMHYQQQKQAQFSFGSRCKNGQALSLVDDTISRAERNKSHEMFINELLSQLRTGVRGCFE